MVFNIADERLDLGKFDLTRRQDFVYFSYQIWEISEKPDRFLGKIKRYGLRAHLCTAVDSMRRKPWVRNCSREREGLYNGNVQQNPLCAVSCVTKDVTISPRFSPANF